MKKIETERLLLRGIVKDDAEDILEYAKNPNVGPRAGWMPHKNMRNTKEVMKEVFINQENTWGITLKENGKMIGSIGLVEDPKRKNDEVLMLGYSLAEEHWGQGLVTEAAKAVVKYGFEDLKLPLISAYCYDFNAASARIMEKLGMKFEGKQAAAEKRYDGKVFDNLLYSISKEDYFNL